MRSLKKMMMRLCVWDTFSHTFFLYIFRDFLYILCTSAAPQRPAHGTVSSQVATHLRIDRVCRVLERRWI